MYAKENRSAVLPWQWAPGKCLKQPAQKLVVLVISTLSPQFLLQPTASLSTYLTYKDDVI